MTEPARAAELERRPAPDTARANRPATAGGPAGPVPSERHAGNNATATLDGARPSSEATAQDDAKTRADQRARAHRLVAGVEEMLVKYTHDAADKARGWGGPVTPYTVDLRCREALASVRRLESALREGTSFYADRWTSAIGALKLAQPYLERLVQPNGPVQVAASIRALERAAGLAPGQPVPGPPVPPPPPPPSKPLAHGWHRIVDDSGETLGYVEVVEATYHRYWNEELQYVGGWEAPIVSEGLGPLDYIPIAAGLATAAYRITGALASALAKSFIATATKRAAARAAVIGGAVMGGVAEAAPAVAGRAAPHAFILSESLASDVVAAEARVAARSAVSAEAESAAVSEASTAAGGSTAKGATSTTTATTTTTTRAGGTTVAGGAGAAAPDVPRHVASLGEQAEAPVLQEHHQQATQLTEKYRGYDAYEGGTVTSFPTLEKAQGREPILVWNRVVSGAHWISLKRVLQIKDVTPKNIYRHVDTALRAMEREANEQVATTPRRSSIPIAQNTYLRIYKKDPKSVTLHITTPGPLSAELTREIEEAARQAALKSDRLADIPPFTLLINGKQIPLK